MEDTGDKSRPSNNVSDSCKRWHSGPSSECNDNVIAICKAINSGIEPLTLYVNDTAGLPNGFLIFTIKDKLTLFILTLQSIINSALVASTSPHVYSTDMNVVRARENVTKFFNSILTLLKQLEKIAISSPPGCYSPAMPAV